MNSAPIPHNRSLMGPSEEVAALRALRSGRLGQGPEVEAFEDEFCAYLGLPARHAVAVSSGTAALFLALRALGAEDREVGIPAYGCASLRYAGEVARARVRLLDSVDGGPHADPSGAGGVFSAIVPHWFGLPADLASYRAAGIRVIEDCAQSIGASVEGRPAGTVGDAGVFSFYSTKLMTSAGQGGMVVSRDRGLADAARDYREFDGRMDDRSRFNFQMTEVQAAVGRAQLARLPDFLARRAEIFDRYRAAVPGWVGADAPGAVRYRAVLRDENPSRIVAGLAARGVRAVPPYTLPDFIRRDPRFPRANRFAESTVSVPLYPALSDAEVATIERALSELV